MEDLESSFNAVSKGVGQKYSTLFYQSQTLVVDQLFLSHF